MTKRQSENYSLNASAPLARINDGTITHCWYRGAITAKGSLGGLVYTNNGTIEACYVYAGELGGSRIEMHYGGWAGGIAYENTGTIANSYFYGDIAQAQSGGTVRDIIGWGAITYKNSGTVSNCYYGADSDDGYGGKTKDQFRGGEVTYLLNGGTAGTTGGRTAMPAMIPPCWTGAMPRSGSPATTMSACIPMSTASAAAAPRPAAIRSTAT